jgi:uncharacterized protein (DUF2141 family)
MKIAILILSFGCLLLAPSLCGQRASLASGGVLSVVITDFKNDKGTVVVMLYNSVEGFPQSAGKALKVMTLPIVNKQSHADFGDLPFGEYAVSVYHDQNGNKKLDTNFLGIPNEGVGNSNNAKGHFGPPKYSDAKFMFTSDKQTITIKIVYL